MFNRILRIVIKKVVIWLCKSNVNCEFRQWKLQTVASLLKVFLKFTPTVDQRTKFAFGKIPFFSEVMILLCLQIAQMEQLDRKRFSVGAHVKSCCSMLALGNSKNVVVKLSLSPFCPKIFVMFHQETSTVWGQSFWQKDWFGVVVVKRRRIS